MLHSHLRFSQPWYQRPTGKPLMLVLRPTTTLAESICMTLSSKTEKKAWKFSRKIDYQHNKGCVDLHLRWLAYRHSPTKATITCHLLIDLQSEAGKGSNRSMRFTVNFFSRKNRGGLRCAFACSSFALASPLVKEIINMWPAKKIVTETGKRPSLGSWLARFSAQCLLLQYYWHGKFPLWLHWLFLVVDVKCPDRRSPHLFQEIRRNTRSITSHLDHGRSYV
jgi:hypothetical protein